MLIYYEFELLRTDIHRITIKKKTGESRSFESRSKDNGTDLPKSAIS